MGQTVGHGDSPVSGGRRREGEGGEREERGRGREWGGREWGGRK